MSRSKRTVFKSETDLARQVVLWLQDQNWEVYQEVDMGGVADIVAVQGPLTWVIECKLSMGIALMEQAAGWIGQANYVSVAIPYVRHNVFCRRVLKWLGIGILEVAADTSYRTDQHGSAVKEETRPRLSRKVKGKLRAALCEAHKTYAEAGNNQGRRWSPFK
jgi:hypothetical protein